MGWVIFLVAAGRLASSMGYFIHRWWFLGGVIVLGIVSIVIDISTRNLIGAGHDDRGLVAMIETLGILIAACTLHRGWRATGESCPPPARRARVRVVSTAPLISATGNTRVPT